MSAINAVWHPFDVNQTAGVRATSPLAPIAFCRPVVSVQPDKEGNRTYGDDACRSTRIGRTAHRERNATGVEMTERERVDKGERKRDRGEKKGESEEKRGMG